MPFVSRYRGSPVIISLVKNTSRPSSDPNAVRPTFPSVAPQSVYQNILLAEEGPQYVQHSSGDKSNKSLPVLSVLKSFIIQMLVSLLLDAYIFSLTDVALKNVAHSQTQGATCTAPITWQERQRDLPPDSWANSPGS